MEILNKTKTVDSLDDAIDRAKWMRDRCTDIETSTKKLEFQCNGGIYVSCKKGIKEPMKLSDTAASQVCHMLTVPNQWVRVKQQMEDPEDLAASLNRHSRKLPSKGILVRKWDGKDPFIRAVFPDNYAILDCWEALKAIRSKMGKKIKEWPILTFSGFKLRVLGLIGQPKIKESYGTEDHKIIRGILPGIHIFVSEDGSYPMGCEVGLYRALCSNTMVLADDRFRPFRLKRREKEEGGLIDRFKGALDETNESLIPAWKKTVGRIVDLAHIETGQNKREALKSAAKVTGIPRLAFDPVSMAWDTDDLFGLWNGLTRYGSALTTEGNFHRGVQLQKSAGALARLSPALQKEIQVASNRKDKD